MGEEREISLCRYTTLWEHKVGNKHDGGGGAKVTQYSLHLYQLILGGDSSEKQGTAQSNYKNDSNDFISAE